MIDLTVVVIGKTEITVNNSIEVLSTNEENIIDVIKKAKGKYITFVSDKDYISENYLEIILNKTKEEFDCCFINYDYSLERNNNKILKNKKILKEYKPYYKDYIWSYIFKKDKLEKLIKIDDLSKFNEIVDKEFEKIEVIEEPIYYHNPNQSKRLNDFIYTDVKNIKKYKNIIYVASGCNGIFNGYISWIKQLGNCFGNKYEVTILYDEINETTKKLFEKHFKCIKNETSNLYICDRLLVTYTSYHYPKNILNLDKSYLFIHGNMSDYENAIRYHDDIYTNYIAVSKTSAEKAKGYFPTDNIEYVINPYMLDEEKAKSRLKLTSTLRYTKVKCPERIEKMAKLMDELEIPYTWEVFADKKENTNVKGLIFRERVTNPLPYVADSDYFVLLSDSEACSYSILEALSLKTKIVVTPLGMYEELGLKNNDIATIIPFEYFDDGNEDKLKEVILKMYKNKDKKVDYKLDKSLWNKYNDIFT
jgi:hypothetical protein